VLFWNAEEQDLPSGVFDLAVTVSTNVFRGERSLQLTWEDARVRRKEASGEMEEIATAEVVSHGQESNKAALLRDLSEKESAEVWLEGRSVDGVRGKARHELRPCKSLIVGTLPPSRSVLLGALERCDPEGVHVVGLPLEVDSLEGFSRRLLGLSKHAIRSGKVAPLPRLAAAMAHEEETVRLGLEWLERRGQIRARETDEGFSIGPGSGKGEADAPSSLTPSSLTKALKETLEEARAFRKYAFQGEEALFEGSTAT